MKIKKRSLKVHFGGLLIGKKALREQILYKYKIVKNKGQKALKLKKWVNLRRVFLSKNFEKRVS